MPLISALGEEEAGGLPSLRAAWSIEQIQGELGLHIGNPISKEKKEGREGGGTDRGAGREGDSQLLAI